jgi:hypothetical protein
MNRCGSSLWRVGQRRRRLNACNDDRHRRDRGDCRQYPDYSDPALEFIALHASSTAENRVANAKNLLPSTQTLWMGQGLLITAANALICIKSSYSTENFRQWVKQAGLIMPIRQKPGR